MWINGEEQEAPVGYGEMLTGEMVIPGFGKTTVGTSGAWTSENTYRAFMYHVESPHAIFYTFTFNGNEVAIDSEYNVTFGPAARPQVVGVVE
jgi:hypothetical protein